MNKKVKVLSKHEYLIKRFIELPVSIITFEEISHAKVYINELQQENQQLHNKIDKAIEYIKKYQQIYDIDGSIEKQIDEFNILASPKKLLEILKDSDVDEKTI